MTTKQLCINLNIIPRDDDDEIMEEYALAVLLANDVISVNSYWWKKHWPDECRKLPGLFVNCNDVFAWGAADGEDCYYSDIANIFEFWEKDPEFGPIVWCCIRRHEEPQLPMREKIEAGGLWNFKHLNLAHNKYDHIVERYAALRWLKANAM